MLSRVCKSGGFSAVELLFVLAVAGVASAIAVPMLGRTTGDLRLQNDARAIHNMVSLAKMRAATRSSRERFFVDLGSKTFYLQYRDRTTGAWINEDGSRQLSQNVNFGFGAIGTPPDNTQSSIQQASLCQDNSSPPQDIPNTACVVFNSRGIPVDATGAPYGNAGFYVTDTVGVYAITVSATPLVRLWWSPVGKVAWVHK